MKNIGTIALSVVVASELLMAGGTVKAEEKKADVTAPVFTEAKY